MLNKEIHKEQVQSLKFKVQSDYENLTSAFGMQGHPELDSGSDTWGLEPEACSYLSPQKPFAYEACLTRMKNEKLKMKNVENCQSSNSNLQYNGCCTGNRLKFLNTTISISINFLHLFEGEYPEYSGGGGAIPSLYLNASTLIDLRYSNQTQTERINTDLTARCRILSLRSECFFVVASALILVNSEAASGISENNGFNFNKNRIDKQLILKKCQSTNNAKTFCDFNLDEIHEESQITLFEPCLPGAQISPHFLKGEYTGRRVGRRGFDSIRVSNPERINRTVLTKN